MKTAALHLISNDVNESPFDITLTVSASSAILSSSCSTGTEGPVSAESFTATGNTVNFTLNYVPSPGAQLMVVNNTGPIPSYIEGTFNNLAHGVEVNLTFGGMIYHFSAWYYGGNGNDFVLL